MKSEIFKPLIDEAYKFAEEVTKDTPSQFEGVFLGRYTELILQRSVDICLNIRDPEDPTARPGDVAAQFLIQHFGITDTTIEK